MTHRCATVTTIFNNEVGLKLNPLNCRSLYLKSWYHTIYSHAVVWIGFRKTLRWRGKDSTTLTQPLVAKLAGDKMYIAIPSQSK